MSYIFGGNTGISYDQLQKEREREKQLREMADAMQGRIGTPSTFGAGLTALGAGLAARNKRRKAGELEKSNNAAEAAGRERAQSAFQQLWGSRYGATPDSGSTGGTGAYRDAIASIESAGSGDYGAIGPTNPRLGRALGRYQIMEANIGPWSREALGREVTPDEFLKNPQIQDAIFDHKFNGYVEQFGPEGAAQAWFAGPGGVGKLDRKDVLGTTVADYTDKFRGALGGGTTSARQPQGTQVAGDGATVDQIMQVMASDEYNYMSPEQKSALGTLLKQRMEANDPLRQQQLALGEIELENARNPEPKERDTQYIEGVGLVDTQTGEIIQTYDVPQSNDLPSQAETLRWRAAQAGLVEGTPEYQAFILNGGGDPSNFRALHMQALSAGYEEGSPEYQEFMATRGAGAQSYARGIGANQADIETGGAAASAVAQGQVEGKAAGERVVGASSEIASADETIRLIDDVLMDPGLPDVVGNIQGRMNPEGFSGLFMSQEARNLMPKIAQLQGKAFLQAFEGLKGGGQITEREGQAATAAQARIQSRYVDDETYKEALRDLRRIAENAKRRARGEEVPEYVPQWFEQETTGRQAGGQANAATGNYSQMSMSELVSNPPTTEAEAAAWNRRFDALQGGQ